LERIILSDHIEEHESVQIIDNKLYLNINMAGIPLPEGECGNFVEYFTPVIENYIANNNNISDLEIVWNHPFESNMMLINGKWWYETAWQWCDSHKILPENVTYITGNFCIFEQYKRWHRIHRTDRPMWNLEVLMQMLWCYAPKIFNQDREQFDLDYCNVDTDRPLGYAFNTLNRVPRRNRMSLFAKLEENQLLDKGLCSFNEVQGHMDGSNFGYDGLILSKEQSEKLPLFLDKPEGRTAQEWIYNSVNVHQYYPEVTEHTNHYAPILENSLVSVVAETNAGVPEMIWYHNTESINWYPYYKEGFITEKTFRTIANGHPVLWVSSPGTVAVMKRLGFRTFNDFWSEDYDKIQDPEDRLDEVIKVLKGICELTVDQRKEMYNDMKPRLKYNQQLILDMEELPKLTWKDYHEYLKYEL
tara:strand:- start:334 stop:1581 length:1248 start_codon:yes stop_codon:yes gene_type:complete